MTISNLKKTWTSTALFEFGLAKFDIRQPAWPKVKFKVDFLLLISRVLQGPFTRYFNNMRVIFTSHIFYNIEKYTIIPSFTKRFEIMMAATLGKTLGTPMPKRSNDSYLQEN